MKRNNVKEMLTNKKVIGGVVGVAVVATGATMYASTHTNEGVTSTTPETETVVKEDATQTQDSKDEIKEEVQQESKQDNTIENKSEANSEESKVEANETSSNEGVKNDTVKQDNFVAQGITKYEKAKKGTVVNISSVLNVRSGAGKNHEVIGTLCNGTKLDVTGKSGNWYEINFNSGKGFVYGAYVNVASNPSAQGSVTGNKVENVKPSENNNIEVKPSQPQVQEQQQAPQVQEEQNNTPQVETPQVQEEQNNKPQVEEQKPEVEAPQVEEQKPEVDAPSVDEEQKPEVDTPQVETPQQPEVEAPQQPQEPEVETPQQPSEPENNGDNGHDTEVNPSEPEVEEQAPSKPENNGDQGHGEVVKPSEPEKPQPQPQPETPDQGQGEVENQGQEEQKPSVPVQPEIINSVPTLIGHGVTIDEGTNFSVDMLNLKAHDKEDGDLTGSIQVVSNNVNTATPGDYTVTVKVTDSKGASIQKSFTVTVKEVIKQEIINAVPILTGHGITIEEGTKFEIGMLELNASDAEDGDLTDKIQVIENNVNTDKAGEYTVRVKVSDSKGASIAKSFTVIVKAKPVEEKNEAPVITANDVTIEQGTPWTMTLSNVSAKDKEDGDITHKVEASGTVDCNTVGQYKVVLTVKDSKGLTATKTITVTVKAKEVQPPVKPENTAPVIEGQNVTIKFGAEFNNSMLNVTANDKEDGDLTPSVTFSGTVNTNVAGDYTITATVRDKQGLETSREFTVTVLEKENTAPVINGKDITIEFGSKFDNSMLGVTVEDAEDKTEDIKVVYEGEVNTNVAGNYTITVTATDTKGLSTTKTFTVTVKEQPNTAPQLIGGKDITIEQGTEFNNSMLGVTATDKEQGDLTSSIVFEGTVDVNTPGTYKVTATIVDAQGLKDSKTFTVTVKAKEVQGMEINSSQFQQMFRSKFLSKINDYRASKGIGAFKEDGLATQLSDIKVQDMVEYGYFDHTNPNTGTAVDSKWDSVLPDANDMLNACGENIYQSSKWNTNGRYTEKDVDAIVDSVFNAWKNSPVHNSTMLSISDVNFGISIKATDKYIVISMDIYEEGAFE